MISSSMSWASASSGAILHFLILFIWWPLATDFKPSVIKKINYCIEKSIKVNDWLLILISEIHYYSSTTVKSSMHPAAWAYYLLLTYFPLVIYSFLDLKLWKFSVGSRKKIVWYDLLELVFAFKGFQFIGKLVQDDFLYYWKSPRFKGFDHLKGQLLECNLFDRKLLDSW